MLAQNFMTAKELNLDDKQYTALVGVLGMLERGEVKWSDYRENRDKGLSFNMSDFQYEHRCGSVCCIAGLADKVFDTGFENWAINREENNGLSDLFFMEDPDPDYGGVVGMYDVTTEQAAQALRNFLSTGQPNWKEVLA